MMNHIKRMLAALLLICLGLPVLAAAEDASEPDAEMEIVYSLIGAGSVQYAAKGTAEDGRAFVALVVKSGFVPGNPANNMTLPTYQIWIDAATHEIFLADMLTGQFYEGFEMPQGNDTTLSVRACFIAAAQYYCSVVR